jgi:hypothetical protein
MRIAIVAIFKNECEYVLEWIAYHRSVIGIKDFIIADNVSDDGTTQLLEALDQAGEIKRIFFPRESETDGPQVPAYNHIIEKYSADYDYFLFIDADEFLVNNTGLSLERFISEFEVNEDFGSLTLNWRIFGSSGNTYRQDGLVIERFYRAANLDEKVNCHVKSLVSSKAVEKMHIHQVDLKEGFACYDETKQKAKFLSLPSDPEPCEGNRTAPFTQNINNSLLYVAHFAVKSKAEHFFKKAGRGSAGGLSSREKGRQYFIGHDLNQQLCLDLFQHVENVEAEIKVLKKSLREKSPFYHYSHVFIDRKDDCFSGWIAIDSDFPLTLNCVLDNKREVELPLNKIRKDVFDKGMAKNKLCGFSYQWSDIGNYGESIKIWIKGGNLMIYESTIS